MKYLKEIVLSGLVGLSAILPYNSTRAEDAKDLGGLVEKLEQCRINEKTDIIQIPKDFYIEKDGWHFFKTPIIKHSVDSSDGGPYEESKNVITIFANMGGKLFIPIIPVRDACYSPLEFGKANIGINPNNDYPEIVAVLEKNSKKNNTDLYLFVDECFIKSASNNSGLNLMIFRDLYKFQEKLEEFNLDFKETDIEGIFGSRVSLISDIKEGYPIIIYSGDLKMGFGSLWDITEEQKKIILEEKHGEWINCENSGKGKTFLWLYYTQNNKTIIEKLFE